MHQIKDLFPHVFIKYKVSVYNQKQIKHSIETMTQTSAKKRQYVKISNNQKQLLLHLVFYNGLKIREAAQKLNLKYAAAKTFVLQFRKKLIRKEFNYASNKPCQTCPKRDQNTSYKIISQIGGKEISSNTYKSN